MLIIECKLKENVYQNRENYIRIEDALKKIYDNNENTLKNFVHKIQIKGDPKNKDKIKRKRKKDNLQVSKQK